jgi:hypothetical protein
MSADEAAILGRMLLAHTSQIEADSFEREPEEAET